MFSMIQQWIFKGIGCLILTALICLGVHKFLEEERQIGYNRAVAEYSKRQLLAEQAARERESYLSKQLQEAQNAAAIREQQIQNLSAALTHASDGLRDSVSTLRRDLPAATLDAIRKTADTALAVFSDCQIKYGELAEITDRHASDVVTLKQAWPK